MPAANPDLRVGASFVLFVYFVVNSPRFGVSHRCGNATHGASLPLF